MAPGSGAKEDPRAALARACAALKVFPLPGVVVLPGAPAPFHVFEPRYRALFADALAGDRILAVPTLVSAEDAAEERPPLHPVAGAVIIEASEAREDGTSDVLVRGVARVRLVEELSRGVPYREFRAEILEDVYPAGGPAALAAEVQAVQQLVYELSAHLPTESGAPQLVEAVSQLRDPAAVADLVAAATVSEEDARLAVIADRVVASRLDRVKAELAGVVLLLSRGRNPTV